MRDNARRWIVAVALEEWRQGGGRCFGQLTNAAGGDFLLLCRHLQWFTITIAHHLLLLATREDIAGLVHHWTVRGDCLERCTWQLGGHLLLGSKLIRGRLLLP